MKNRPQKSLKTLLICCLLFSSPATLAVKKNNQQLTNDVSNLQQELGSIKKEMKRLQQLLNNRALLELFQRMDELGSEVSELRGVLEQQNHDLAGLKKRQRELYLDSDRRLRELEISSTRSPVPMVPSALPAFKVKTPPTSRVSTPPAIPRSAQAAPLVKPPIPAVSTPGATKPATIQSGNKPNVSVSEEREYYQVAFDLLKEGRYKKANTSFKAFLSRFPQSSYAGNAQYWLGESNYVTRQFEQAVKEFQTVLEKYPASNKTPDAMLKLGYTYYELRQFDAAKSILIQLRKTYEKSTAARLAGKRLDRMKKEGQ